MPRPSKKEGKIKRYLIHFAGRAGLEYQEDSAGNLVIRKPASPGRENTPTVVLQSHMDMVCEKNSDVTFDFDRDPIRVKVVDGWVCAEGTTLGADDGIGMAAALAILVERDLQHGPIEALFTVDEETGLTGACNLGGEMLTGRYLINLDSEDEGEIFIGCAGGIDTVATFHDQEEELSAEYFWYSVRITRLKGGHSGCDIGEGLANANKLMTRLLWHAERRFGMRLVSFDGGNLHNAIPREAFAHFGIPAASAEAFKTFFAHCVEEIKKEFQEREPSINIELSAGPPSETAIDTAVQRNLLHALQGLPNGVLAMSRTMEGLVESSTNLASVKFPEEGKIVVTTSQRSSLEGARLDAAATVEAVFALAGAEVVHSEGYPGWTPDPSSHLLAVTREVYNALFGKEPRVRAIHAGLECGLFLKKYPHLEMVSIGPTLRGVHSPDERLEVASVEKFWRLLVGMLEELSKERL